MVNISDSEMSRENKSFKNAPSYEPEIIMLDEFNRSLTVHDANAQVLVECRGKVMLVYTVGDDMIVYNQTEGGMEVVKPTYSLQVSRTNSWFSDTGVNDFPRIENINGNICVNNLSKEGTKVTVVHKANAGFRNEADKSPINDPQAPTKGYFDIHQKTEAILGDYMLGENQLERFNNPKLIRITLGEKNHTHTLTLELQDYDANGLPNYMIYIEDPDVETKNNWVNLPNDSLVTIGRGPLMQGEFWFTEEKSYWISRDQLSIENKNGIVSIKRNGMAATTLSVEA